VVYHGRVFATMSLLTELGILMERLFYKYSAPHGACGAKTGRGPAQERRRSRFERGAFHGLKMSLLSIFRLKAAL
jgi:hypothetical protein